MEVDGFKRSKDQACVLRIKHNETTTFPFTMTTCEQIARESGIMTSNQIYAALEGRQSVCIGCRCYMIKD